MVDLTKFTIEDQEEFAESFKKYLGKVLRLLFCYLLIKDPILQTLDFVLLNPEDKSIKAKILKFNETFQIIPPSQIVSLNKEIIRFYLVQMKFYLLSLIQRILLY